jgi:hypothetical protein
MKKFTLSMFLASILALPIAQAADEEDHSAHHPGAGQEQADTAPDNKAAGMKMDKMQERMKKMQDLMSKIHSTSDPKERQRLMEEHMDSMRDSMKMMRGMGKDMMGKKHKGDRPAGDGADKDGMMGCMMMKKHQMTEDRIDMMQKMMEQIIEREAAEQEMEHGK